MTNPYESTTLKSLKIWNWSLGIHEKYIIRLCSEQVYVLKQTFNSHPLVNQNIILDRLLPYTA